MKKKIVGLFAIFWSYLLGLPLVPVIATQLFDWTIGILAFSVYCLVPSVIAYFINKREKVNVTFV